MKSKHIGRLLIFSFLLLFTTAVALLAMYSPKPDVVEKADMLWGLDAGITIGVIIYLLGKRSDTNFLEAVTNINLLPSKTLELLRDWTHDDTSAILIRDAIERRCEISENYARALSLLMHENAANIDFDVRNSAYMVLHSVAGLKLHKYVGREVQEILGSGGLSAEENRRELQYLLQHKIRAMLDICSEDCAREALMPLLETTSFDTIKEMFDTARKYYYMTNETEDLPVTITDAADAKYKKFLTELEQELREKLAPVTAS